MVDSNSSPLERRQAVFSGNVQGVGFRDATRRLAQNYAVAGFVRNVPDGRVELVAEGAPTELTKFLAAVRERLADYIRHATVDARPGNGEFTEFEIRH
jgi:acylphosphatase